MTGGLLEFTRADEARHRIGKEKVLGPLYGPLKAAERVWRRLMGQFSPDDGLVVACCCEPPYYFLKRGCMIGHSFGITLSVDEIGADCRISQNVTIGSSDETREIGEAVKDKPRLGNLVLLYPGAVVSGKVRVGSRVIIGANAFVDKDVPDDSVVYGRNEVSPLKEHHRKYLKMQLYMAREIYRLVPGLVFRNGRMYIDQDYAARREALFKSL